MEEAKFVAPLGGDKEFSLLWGLLSGAYRSLVGDPGQRFGRAVVRRFFMTATAATI